MLRLLEVSVRCLLGISFLSPHSQPLAAFTASNASASAPTPTTNKLSPIHLRRLLLQSHRTREPSDEQLMQIKKKPIEPWALEIVARCTKSLV